MNFYFSSNRDKTIDISRRCLDFFDHMIFQQNFFLDKFSIIKLLCLFLCEFNTNIELILKNNLVVAIFTFLQLRRADDATNSKKKKKKLVKSNAYKASDSISNKIECKLLHINQVQTAEVHSFFFLTLRLEVIEKYRIYRRFFFCTD